MKDEQQSRSVCQGNVKARYCKEKSLYCSSMTVLKVSAMKTQHDEVGVEELVRELTSTLMNTFGLN